MRNYTPNEMKILDAIMDKIDKQVSRFTTTCVETTSRESCYVGVFGKVDGKECEGGFSIRVVWTEGD